MLEIPAVLVQGDKRPPDFELVKTSNSVRLFPIKILLSKSIRNSSTRTSEHC